MVAQTFLSVAGRRSASQAGMPVPLLRGRAVLRLHARLARLPRPLPGVPGRGRMHSYRLVGMLLVGESKLEPTSMLFTTLSTPYVPRVVAMMTSTSSATQRPLRVTHPPVHSTPTD